MGLLIFFCTSWKVTKAFAKLLSTLLKTAVLMGLFSFAQFGSRFVRSPLKATTAPCATTSFPNTGQIALSQITIVETTRKQPPLLSDYFFKILFFPNQITTFETSHKRLPLVSKPRPLSMLVTDRVLRTLELLQVRMI